MNELELSQEQYRILGIYRFGRSASDTKKVHHFGWTKGVTEQDSNQVRGSSNPNVDGCLHQTASQRYSKKYRILGIAIFGNHKQVRCSPVNLGRTLTNCQTISVEVIMTYRKRKGSDTWHWCTNCSNWPTSDYDVTYSKPSSGELCDQCKAKEKANECRTSQRIPLPSCCDLAKGTESEADESPSTERGWALFFLRTAGL